MSRVITVRSSLVYGQGEVDEMCCCIRGACRLDVCTHGAYASNHPAVYSDIQIKAVSQDQAVDTDQRQFLKEQYIHISSFMFINRHYHFYLPYSSIILVLIYICHLSLSHHLKSSALPQSSPHQPHQPLVVYTKPRIQPTKQSPNQ